MATIVVYNSKSGFTKQYAEWIANELDCGVVDSKKVNLFTLNMYDIIVYGGCVNASKICGLNLIANNMDVLKQKKVIVFSCGLMNDEETMNTLKAQNFKGNMLSSISYYHLLGGVDLSKLNFIYRFILKKAGQMIASKKGETADFSTPTFLGSKDMITPIVEEAKAYEQELIEKA